MKPWNDWLVSVESLTVINFRCIVHEKTKFLTITFVMLRWSIPKVTVEMNSWNDWLVLLNCSQSQFFCGFFKLSLTSNSLSQWPLLCLEGQFPNLNLSNFSDEIYVRLVKPWSFYFQFTLMAALAYWEIIPFQCVSFNVNVDFGSVTILKLTKLISG